MFVVNFISALPIFNKGKRPKHALIAHPNNQGGISHEAIGLKSQCYGRRQVLDYIAYITTS